MGVGFVGGFMFSFLLVNFLLVLDMAKVQKFMDSSWEWDSLTLLGLFLSDNNWWDESLMGSVTGDFIFMKVGSI